MLRRQFFDEIARRIVRRGSARESDQPRFGLRIFRCGERALGVLLNRSRVVALVLVDGSNLIRIQLRFTELLAAFRDHSQGIVKPVIIPKHSSGFDVAVGFAGRDSGDAVPEWAGAIE